MNVTVRYKETKRPVDVIVATLTPGEYVALAIVAYNHIGGSGRIRAGLTENADSFLGHFTEIVGVSIEHALLGLDAYDAVGQAARIVSKYGLT